MICVSYHVILRFGCFHVKFLQLHVPRRRLRPAPAASFKEDTLVELLKLRLAKDPERSELKIEELEEMEMEVGLDQWMGRRIGSNEIFMDLCILLVNEL